MMRQESGASMTTCVWAGLKFIVLGRHDVSMLRSGGVYALVRRDERGGRALLFAGYGDPVAAAPTRPEWVEATRAGFNELHLHVFEGSAMDGRQLAARVLRAEQSPAPGQGRLRA